MFDNLQDKLDRAFKILKGQGKITEINVAETLKEIRKALLDADVNYKVAKTFTDTVKEKAFGQNVLTSLSPGQLLIKITHDELANLMGGSKVDIYRPAAIDQLHVLGEQIGIEVFSNKEEKNPIKIAEAAIKQAKENGNNVVLIDTAGRLAIDEQMMNEIADLKKAIKPNEILFVVDSMTGQDAVNTAKSFNDRLNFDGVILTKLDGDTRGGAALSIKSIVNKPIKFIGTGEKMEALDVFYPERMADRILGMGDVVSLVERAQEQFSEEESRKLNKKIATNKFDFNDFLAQLNQIKKMGNIKDLVGMIPGMSKAVKENDIKEDAFKGIEAIISSMTPEERSKPELINGSRRQRLAKGSGQGVQEVNKLLKQFEETRKMMRMMNDKNAMAKMMRNMPKGMAGGGKM